MYIPHAYGVWGVYVICIKLKTTGNGFEKISGCLRIWGQIQLKKKSNNSYLLKNSNAMNTSLIDYVKNM